MVDMRISDEIRNWIAWCKPWWHGENSVARDELWNLADRIDAEMVELPKDAEGVPIHIGDTMYTADRSTANVFGIYIMQHKKNVVCTFSDGRSSVYDPHKLSHERPDSLGRIADDIEAAEGWCDKEGEYGTGITSVKESTLHGWAERIRKLAKKEGE